MPRPFNSLDQYQYIIIKLYEEGLGAAEIAARIGCQPPAVRQRLHRAGVELRSVNRNRTERKGGAPKRKQSGDNRIPHLHLPRVDRDPCPRCGIRGDVGCGHSRGRLGWSTL